MEKKNSHGMDAAMAWKAVGAAFAKLTPQAQAYSKFGYRKYAVLPTPDAPIMIQCTSSLSTSAVMPC